MRALNQGLTRYGARRLAEAKRLDWGRPVTAYLTDARLLVQAGFGVVHDHVAQTGDRFRTGHRILTSDVLRVERNGAFWGLHTRSGSLYVVATFARHGGRRSLDILITFGPAALHPAPARWQ